MNRTAPVVAAVVVNWNQASASMACLTSLQQSETPPVGVVLVDNGSGPADLEFLRSKVDRQSNIHLVEVGWNSGFTGGVNAGVSYVLRELQDVDWIFLLNNDAQVDPSAIGTLVETGRNLEAALIGPRVLQSETGRIAFSPMKWPMELFGFRRKLRLDSTAAIVPRLDGCALLIRRDIATRRQMSAGGLLDERFFLYFEDVDLCLQVRSWGERVVYCSDAIVRHRVALSSGGQMNRTGVYYQTRNRILIAKKWLPVPLRILFFLAYPLLRMANLGRCVLRRTARPGETIAGIRDGYASRYGPRVTPKGY